MAYRVVLTGEEGVFTERFRDTVRECGFEIAPKGGPADADDICIAGAASQDGIPEGQGAAPFILHTAVEVAPERVQALKEAGLIGITTPETAPEDVAFLLNKALFYGKMLKRNPRVPVNLAVTLSSGQKVMKSFASLLSRDGMFILTLNPLPVNTVCALRFSVPGIEGELATGARVLYHVAVNKDLNIIANPRDPFKRLVSHPGMAVFFTDMAQSERDSIDRYIETLL